MAAHAGRIDARPWLEMPHGRRVVILGDVYSAPGEAPAPLGVYDRATRSIWLRAQAAPPLRQDIALWSLTGLARALGRDPAELRAALLSEAGPGGYRAVPLEQLQEWFVPPPPQTRPPSRRTAGGAREDR